MPIYEYRCSNCKDDFEISQKITDSPLTECPKCQGALEKLVSQTSFVLKGGGWHATDYGRNAGNKAPSTEGATPCAQGGASPACSGCPSAGA